MSEPSPPAPPSPPSLPSSIEPIQIGRSVLGRPIHAYAIGRPGRPVALIHGGIHGDEPASVTACLRLLGVRPSHLTLTPDAPRIVVVPAVNPDGLAAGTKDNARGVDLNRNFPAHNFTTNHPPGYDPGPSPLSEPESAALAALCDFEAPRRIVAIHQPFRCVNYDGPARPLAEAMSAACGWPVMESVGYPTPGSFGSCYGVDRGIEVITLELPRPATDSDLEAAVAALLVACREA